MMARPRRQSRGENAEIKSTLTDVSKQTGEIVQLGRTATLEGEFVGGYVYTTAGKGKIAVLMAFAGKPDDALVSHLGMHIVAARPTRPHPRRRTGGFGFPL